MRGLGGVGIDILHRDSAGRDRKVAYLVRDQFSPLAYRVRFSFPFAGLRIRHVDLRCCWQECFRRRGDKSLLFLWSGSFVSV